MNLDTVIKTAIDPAMALLKGVPDGRDVRCLLLAIGLQESRFEFRRQLGNGPARGFWQFERGTAASKGGVWGVFLHPVSAALLQQLCAARGVVCEPSEIWRAIEHDDVLAAGLARLLILTDPAKLPVLGDVDGAWRLYAQRCWRPGKPHPQTWPAYYARALEAVQ